MKDTDIAKIRQLLKEIRDNFPKANYIEDCKSIRLLEEVLALLPCETCNGIGKKPRLIGEQHCPLKLCVSKDACCGKCDHYIPRKPCPDCQKKPIDK